MKDWVGNKNSIFKTLGASNHTDTQREINDYYATEPKAVELLLQQESFSNNIWEPASGENHIANVLIDKGYQVKTSDIVKRLPTTEECDFLSIDNTQLWEGDIITNPPYKYATDFIWKALSIIPDGNKIAMFLKLQFMEGKNRKRLFMEYPPKVIYVSSSILMCAKNGDFDFLIKSGGSAVAYAWYIWVKGFVGNTIIKWIN